jgi:hypothetical protein
MSYARYLIRRNDSLDSGMALHCSGRTGGVCSDNGSRLNAIQDGDGLDTLIRTADEHRPRCEWAVCPDDERERPPADRAEAVRSSPAMGQGIQGRAEFCRAPPPRLQRLGRMAASLRMQGQIRVREQPVLVTRNGVSYEVALMAIFRAMGDEMPEDFRSTTSNNLVIQFRRDRRSAGVPPGARVACAFLWGLRSPAGRLGEVGAGSTSQSGSFWA